MKPKIKQLVCFLLACQLFMITAWAKPDWPADTGIQAEAGIVMDVDSGAVLFGQNIHQVYPPASITKLLTALIVLEHCQLDEVVTFSETAMNSVEPDSGNKLSLVAGDQMTVEDCLYSLLHISVNQAANALAEHVAGSIPAFVDMMNAKLDEIGCVESHFDNPSGLNGDTQNVSAYDMALIAQAAYRNETLLKINSDLTHTIGPTTNNPEGNSFRTEHRLLYTDDSTSQFYFPEAVAGKTGYLLKAGNTLVTYAEKDGRHLVSVILKGQPRQYFVDGKELLSFGFRSFQNVVIAEQESRYVTGEETLSLDTGSFKASDLMIEPGKVITLPLGATFADAELTLTGLPKNHPGDAVALLQYTYDERVIGTAYLMAKDGVLVNGTDADETSAAATDADDSQPAASPDTAGKKEPRSLVSTLIVLLVFLVIALAAGAVAWVIYSRKKEAEELARRRERRRQRLQQSGEADEFERLLTEMKQKENSRRH